MCSLRYGDLHEAYGPKRNRRLGGGLPAPVKKAANKDAPDALPGLQCGVR